MFPPSWVWAQTPLYNRPKVIGVRDSRGNRKGSLEAGPLLRAWHPAAPLAPNPPTLRDWARQALPPATWPRGLWGSHTRRTGLSSQQTRAGLGAGPRPVSPGCLRRMGRALANTAAHSCPPVLRLGLGRPSCAGLRSDRAELQMARGGQAGVGGGCTGLNVRV